MGNGANSGTANGAAELNIDLLRNVCKTPGVPGFEKQIRELVIREVEPLVDELRVDKMGNVIALKKGHGDKKVMVAAHMDEIGFIVKHIDEEGFLHFHTLGGFDPKTLTAQRVIVHGKKDLIGVMGSKPIHLMDEEERKRLPKAKEYFIDLGMKKEEVEQLVRIGDPVTRERELIEMGDCINCKSLDNRISVFILMETLRRVKELPFDLYAVFTVQEEVGLRGAMVAAHAIEPDFGFALDTTIAYDVPGARPEEMITKMGNGAAIKIMDAGSISDYRMVQYMKDTANKHDVKWQPEVLTGGATDAAGMQRMAMNGVITGAVSIPTRHIHQVIEMVHKEDVASAIDLLQHCIQDLDGYDWGW